MRKPCGLGLLLALVVTVSACHSHPSSAPANAPPAAETAPPMILTATVPLEGVKGRFDHFASGKGKVFVSGLGNNSVEVIDLFQGALAHEITGVPNPQGVTFSPEANKLFVASEKGKVYIYDGDSYKLITTLDFDGGADNMRYDAATKRVYVGCGDDEKNAAIAAIDAMTNKRLDEVYKLGGEPESFQLEKNGPNIYVNVPDLKQIVAINRTTKELTRWPLTDRPELPHGSRRGRSPSHRGHARTGNALRFRHDHGKNGRLRPDRSGHGRFVLQRRAQARLRPGTRWRDLGLPADRSGSLQPDLQDSHGRGRGHGGILWKAGERL